MLKLFTYVLYGLLLNIANKNLKKHKKVNTLWLQNAYTYLKICEKNKTCNMKLRNSSHFCLISSQNSRLMKYL